MWFLRIFCLCVVAVVVPVLCSGQDKPFDLCGVSVLAADPSAQTLVEQILHKLVQKAGTILVFASTDPQVAARRGAVSSECPMGNGEQRWIVYDPEVIPVGEGLDFALAHETAHHMNRHVLNGDTRTKQQELEADEYAARYLTLLGWDQTRVLKAVDGLKLPNEAIGGYPSLDERKAAVIAGCREASAGYSKPSLLWSNLVHAPQPADWNNCARPAADIKEFTPSDESVWLYYSFETGSNGRDGTVEWISPGGAVYMRDKFTIPAPATGCYRWFVGIRGDPMSMTPGPWEVRIVYDGIEIGRRAFSIKP